MRYYEQRFPEVDDLVMVQVRQIAEMGAYVKLLEYDNIEGMILLSELSRRRIRSIQKLIRVGRNEVVVVLRVDKEKGYIDLSKRRVSPEDITKCEDRFMKSKTVASIMRHVATKTLGTEQADVSTGGPSTEPSAVPQPAPTSPSISPQQPPKSPNSRSEDVASEGAPPEDEEVPLQNEGEEKRLEQLYDQIAWPLAHKYAHTYDAFKLALTDPDVVFEGLDISPLVRSTLLATIGRRLTPHPVKLRADIELTCFQPAGIDALKAALKAGEAVSTDTVPITAKLVAPPFYVLTTNATDRIGGVDKLEEAIKVIETTITEYGGELTVKMRPKAISETEDQELVAAMNRARDENAEISGDSEGGSDGEE